MNKSSLQALAALAFAAAAAPFPAFADGPAQTAWVSGAGADAAACGLEASPCRTLQFTNDRIVRAGGVILVRDAADYGALTIRMALSVVNVGAGAPTLLATKGVAVLIDAGADDDVTLRGLALDGAGTGGIGIDVLGAGRLTIDGASVRGFSDSAGGYGIGVLIEPRAGAVRFSISRSSFADNSFVHVLVNPNRNGGTGASATGQIGDVAMSGGGYGVMVVTSAPGSSASADIEGARIANPRQTGVYSYAYAASAPASVLARDVMVSGARVAYSVEGAGRLSIANSSAFASVGLDVFAPGGRATAYGGNVLSGSSLVAAAAAQ